MADLLDLLEKTSRTFALSIPPLPEPLRREVTVAYLLFRIADTFEDATHWPKEQRIEALEAFVVLLEKGARADAERFAFECNSAGVTPQAGYRELIAETPFVFDAFRSLSPGAREILRTHVSRSAKGMAGFVARTDDDGLVLDSLEDLRDYCYAVAGIVGELLTELFLLEESSLRPAAPEMRQRSRAFGEALQLVNILKDSEDDAAEGRRYLPASVPTAEVFALARRDLEAAEEYVEALAAHAAPAGLLEFTGLPVALAWSALEAVESRGPGARVPRAEVLRTVHRVRTAASRGVAPVAYHRRLSGDLR